MAPWGGSSACAPSFPDPGCTCRCSNERVTGWADEAILECKTEWVAAHPEKVRLRKYLVEDPSGSISRRNSQGFFAILDPSRVMMEMSLTVPA